MTENGMTPHRGFNTKAREILIGDDYPHSAVSAMSKKSSSDFDIRKRLKNCSLLKRTDSQATNESGPPSESSTQSVNGPPCFDVIGEQPVVKHHKRLEEVGKTKSCMEFKVDKRLMRTYQEDNILKMPSIDSDMDSAIAAQTDFDPLCDNFGLISKSSMYAVSGDEKKKEVKKWLEKSSG